MRQFANKVRQAIRTEDVFARIGGDEFVVFLNVRDLEAAEIVAKRLHELFNGNTNQEGDILTCRLGILVLPNGSQQIDKKLKHADSLMYKAKRQDTGRVMAVAAEATSPEARSMGTSGSKRSHLRSGGRETSPH